MLDAPQSFLVTEFAQYGQIMDWQQDKLMYTCPRLDEGHGGTLPHELARHYFRDVVSAVYYLHGCHIIHRDIKPENILVTHHHVVKLCDLGEAEVIDAKRNPQGLVSETKGTYQFFPPESCVSTHSTATATVATAPMSGSSAFAEAAALKAGVGTNGAYSRLQSGSEDEDDPDNDGSLGGSGPSSSDRIKAGGGSAADGVEEVPSFSGYAADMWAVGVSLFGCIFGILPFFASEPSELFSLIGALSFL